MQIVTKCGIKLKSDKYPERKIKIYDTSKDHIIESVLASLSNLSTDYIDLLLIHRPDPFMDPVEVAAAFYHLEKKGMVLNFGVSNFNPLQYNMLQSSLESKLVTNQIEISPYNLEHFNNGNLDYCLKDKIVPMAWSPLAGGKLMRPTDNKSTRINAILKSIASELGIQHIGQLILAWLLAHPSGIVPILGSGKIENVKSLISTNGIKLSREDWFRIYIASTGRELP
jgi:predicted oxidoreductase